MEIRVIGVVGSGTMGCGIAQVCTQAGFEVILYDLAEELLAKGFNVIKKNFLRDQEKGKKTAEEVEALLAKIRTSTEMSDLSGVDVIIEAVFERMDVKKQLYAQLDQVCPQETLFITNTSGLSVTEIASVTTKLEKMVAMHFFNPVPVMKLVEVIRGYHTSDTVFQQALELSVRLGKEPIAVKEAPLFAVNRILVPMINEAIFVLMEGTASAEDIDKGMQLGANHPIGPLALADLIGLDTLLMVIETLYNETNDAKYRPAQVLKTMVRAGCLGRKSGRGFYEYN